MCSHWCWQRECNRIMPIVLFFIFSKEWKREQRNVLEILNSENFKSDSSSIHEPTLFLIISKIRILSHFTERHPDLQLLYHVCSPKGEWSCIFFILPCSFIIDILAVEKSILLSSPWCARLDVTCCIISTYFLHTTMTVRIVSYNLLVLIYADQFN